MAQVLELDRTDRALLRALTANARASGAALASTLGMQPAEYADLVLEYDLERLRESFEMIVAPTNGAACTSSMYFASRKIWKLSAAYGGNGAVSMRPVESFSCAGMSLGSSATGWKPLLA